eukprot:RCo019102
MFMASETLLKELRALLGSRGLSWEQFVALPEPSMALLLREEFQFGVVERNRLVQEALRNRPQSSSCSSSSSSSSSSCSLGVASTLRQLMEANLTEDGVPVEFLCPISGEVMDDPVFTADGHTYSRRAISQWFIQCPAEVPTSPNTGLPLPTLTLIGNHNLKLQVQRWREQTGRPPPTPAPLCSPEAPAPRSGVSGSAAVGSSGSRTDDLSPAIRWLMAMDDSEDSEDGGVEFTPEALERIVALQGTLARSRATISFLQSRVDQLRSELESDSESASISLQRPQTLPSLRPTPSSEVFPENYRYHWSSARSNQLPSSSAAPLSPPRRR